MERSTCPPESSGFASKTAFSAGADLRHRARGATRHLRLSPVSDGGSSSSRCRFRFPMPQFLAVTASALAVWPSMTALTRRERRSELETPCALRLGEPNQDNVTSDALCRATSLTQELLSCLRQDTRVFHLAIKPAFALRRARTLGVDACLRPLHVALRAPSVGLMFTLVVMNQARSRSLSCFRVRAQHPFENHAPALPVEEEPPCLSTQRRLGSPHGSRQLRGEDASHRPLQPTLNTSTRRSTDSRAHGSHHDDRIDDEPWRIHSSVSSNAASRPPRDNLNPRWINV